MNVMVMLIRREFWEHRMLVLAPLALCVVYLVLCVLFGTNVSSRFVEFGNEAPTAAGFLIVMHTVFTIMLYVIMAFVVFFYLCDCLYAERKDRSILFWKSLPVSDTMTVLSKAIVALICVPVVVYVLSFLTNVLALALFKILFHAKAPAGAAADWTMGGWLRLNGYLIVDILVLALWFAPVAAYQLIMSVVAPRAVFVYTLLPPLTLMIFERLFFGTAHVGEFLGHRLGSVVKILPGSGHQGVEGFINAVNALPLLARLDLWIGVVVAAAGIYLTIRIRRHQQDS